MPKAALKTSLAVAELLRKRRIQLGFTLREVERKTAEAGDPIPYATLAHVERGRLDPGVRRLHFLLKLYKIPPHLVADLIEIEEKSAGPEPEGDVETLYRRGIAHWKSGELGQGLAHLFAVRRRIPGTPAERKLRQSALIAFAFTASEIGKFRLAKEILEELLCEPVEPSLLVHALLHAASVWKRLGSLEVALALSERAERYVRTDEDPAQEAWLRHQKAQLLLASGRSEDAAAEADRAIAAYDRIQDTFGKVRAMLVRASAGEAGGDLPSALRWNEEAVGLASGCGHAQVAALGRLRLGRVLAGLGRGADALKALQEALGQAVLLGDRDLEFQCHDQLWRFHRDSGDPERARFELEAARYFVRFVDETSPQAEEIRGLVEGGREHDARRRGRRKRGS